MGFIVVAPWLQGTGSIVVAHGLVAPQHVRYSQIRDEPMSPAMAGTFFATEPPGKPKPVPFC